MDSFKTDKDTEGTLSQEFERDTGSLPRWANRMMSDGSYRQIAGVSEYDTDYTQETDVNFHGLKDDEYYKKIGRAHV